MEEAQEIHLKYEREGGGRGREPNGSDSFIEVKDNVIQSSSKLVLVEIRSSSDFYVHHEEPESDVREIDINRFVGQSEIAAEEGLEILALNQEGAMLKLKL